MEKICMECQILFSEKNKKKYHQFVVCWISPESSKDYDRWWVQALNYRLILLLSADDIFNPYPAEPGYTLPLQTVKIQISWLLKKPTDLDLHCLSFSMWIYINNLDQIIWLAEN